MQPEISIIVPNYNGARYLRQCIQSILDQSHTDLEIIVADDASEDDSVLIAEDIATQHSRVHVLKQTKNLGLARNKLAAAHVARGRYLTTLDSDDYYYSKQKLQNELSLLKKYESMGLTNVVAYSRTVSVSSRGGFNAIGGFSAPPQGWILPDLISFSMNFEPRDFLTSKKNFMSNGSIDTSVTLYVDWNHKLRLARSCIFVCTNEEGTAYREHEGSRMSSKPPLAHILALSHGFHQNAQHLRTRSRLIARVKLYRHFARLLFRHFVPTFASK